MILTKETIEKITTFILERSDWDGEYQGEVSIGQYTVIFSYKIEFATVNFEDETGATIGGDIEDFRFTDFYVGDDEAGNEVVCENFKEVENEVEEEVFAYNH